MSAVEVAEREDNGTNPYRSSPGGGGAGGKFRKKQYRGSHAATPYDRPPYSIRNLSGLLPSFGGGERNGNDGWLTRIVNPAQRIIAAGAHKLFASVIQKRITKPSPPHPRDMVQEWQENLQEAGNRSSRERQAAVNNFQKASSTNDEGSFVNLENILKQRTFSKSEIDRLTALLHARTLDSSIANEVEKPDVSSFGFHDLKEGSLSIVQKTDGNENHLPTRHAFLNGDVASPDELAKAYMGTRPSKVATSGFREDSILVTSSQHTLKLPVMSLVPASSNQRGVHENGHITPRSRGRSAIYNMARTPYARVHPTTPLKILEPTYKRADGRLVAPQAPEPERLSGSSALKRRSSIFENDIGSFGPLRRIRHKPNLLSQKNNSLLSSMSAASRLVTLPSTESNNKFTDHSVGNDGIAVPSRNMPSSKSSEIASKILQQLDKIVSPPKENSSVVRLASSRDKVSLKLSPSDLHGKALKSLEHIDSSKFLEIATGSSKLNDSVCASNQDSGACALQDIDKAEQSGQSRTHFGFDQLPPAGNRSEEAIVSRHGMLNHKVVDLEETNPLTVPSAPTNQTFKMSAPEDYFDLDDDDRQNETVPNKLIDEGQKLDSTKMKPAFGEDADKNDEPAPVSEVHGLKERKNVESPFTAISGEKTETFSPGMPPTKKNDEPDVQVTSFKPVPETSTLEREPSVVSSVFTFGKKASTGDEEKPAAPVFAFASNGPITKDAEKFNGSSTASFASQSSMAESSSSFSTISAGPIPEMNKGDETKGQSAGFLETPVAPVTAPLTTGLFNFGIPAGPAAASQSSLSLAATSIASPPPDRPLCPLVASSAAEGSNGKSSHSQPASFETSAVAPVEDQTKVVFGSEKATENTFSALSTCSVSSIFGFSSPVSNGASSDKLGSVSFGMSNGPSQVQASTSGSGLSSSTQTVPFQFGSSAPSFGLAGNTNTLSGSFLFGSSSADNFSKGTSSGVTALPSLESTVASSSSSAATNLFGSLQTTAAPAFGTLASSSSSSTGFTFGAMSSSAGPISFGASISSPAKSIFGSFGASTSSNGPATFASNRSSTAPSAAPIFGSAASTSAPAPAFTFGASTTSSSSQPVFGNSSPVFSFYQTSTCKNNQMNTEDVMAEDVAPAATPPASLFGQQPVSQAPPSSNFVFGSGANKAFQFGGQQSFAPPTNLSPFVASGSLDFNSSAGGSFSLGTGRGDKSGRKIIKVKKHRQPRK